MFQKIIEIIVYVVSELRQNKELADIDVQELQNRGYTSSEISTAFSWIADRVEFSSDYIRFDRRTRRESFRVLHEAEQELFSAAAWGEIIQYQILGLLNNDHIEAIIEKALLMGLSQIDSDKLKTMIAALIFNARFEPHSSRLMLLGDDTIN